MIEDFAVGLIFLKIITALVVIGFQKKEKEKNIKQ